MLNIKRTNRLKVLSVNSTEGFLEDRDSCVFLYQSPLGKSPYVGKEGAQKEIHATFYMSLKIPIIFIVKRRRRCGEGVTAKRGTGEVVLTEMNIMKEDGAIIGGDGSLGPGHGQGQGHGLVLVLLVVENESDKKIISHSVS
jgi:hypothetical protein